MGSIGDIVQNTLVSCEIVQKTLGAPNEIAVKYLAEVSFETQLPRRGRKMTSEITTKPLLAKGLR